MSQGQVVTPYNHTIPTIWGGKGCFPADTQILTPTDSMSIQDCCVGDRVLCHTPDGKVLARSITETHVHGKQELLQFIFETDKLTLTPNHWVLRGEGQYDYASEFEIGDTLINLDGVKKIILEIDELPPEIVYNLTVQDYHTFFAEGFRVHNKGGGKDNGPPTEEPNNLFSSDIALSVIALGEGPVYRINPLGPQDIEINEGTIDDLINIDGNGEENSSVFKTIKRTGTLNQVEMPVFGDRVVIPQNLTSGVVLRKGNGGAPASKILLQNTSASDHSELIFSLQIRALAFVDENSGDIHNHNLSVKITVYNRTGLTEIATVSRDFNNKTNTPFAFQISVPIPKENRSRSGYKFTIEKTSNDSESSKIKDVVAFQYWLEVKEERVAYPRTAAVGFGILAHNEHTGGVPNFTSVVKGLLVKVPSNYNQPILANGEIDWRELELPETGNLSYPSNGYRLQSPGTGTIVTETNPEIYMGVWDGTFVYSWTQNPCLGCL